MGKAAAKAFEGVRWTRRRAGIRDASGGLVFTQAEVEAPEHWSDGAVGIVASRYFTGRPGAQGRESSVRALLERVAGTLARWAEEQGLVEKGYEAALLDLLVWQRGAFNSPVWFNVGVDARPQCSACFILSVRDDLDSILDLARTEGLIFKRGSGAGSNLSRLRSSRETLSGGGLASGPVSFMRGYDAFAGVIKSGGRTRRAAKMQILDADHPDILDFVAAKPVEERKARALAAAGFTGGMDGEAYRSVAFQNSNLSVRCPDAFFDAVGRDGTWETRAVTTGAVVERLPARRLLRAMAEAARECGDPGIQYEGAIQAWNPCPASGRIAASNPCSEYLFLDDTACNLASLNLLSFLRGEQGFDVDGFRADVGRLLRAMEAIVDRAGYPTEAIGANSRRFRPLGLGYANLGAALMAQALPYDSVEARGWAAAVTALMAGEAWCVSAEVAARRGPFEAFPADRDAFLAVLARHRAALDGIAAAPAGIVAAARDAWDRALDLAALHGVRNAQATLLAPTGTIALMMDCDTTGIEPDLALVKYKVLAGGGTLRIRNGAVERALFALGYEDGARAAILAHLDAEETIEGAPGLHAEHLPVFDCAFPPARGGRALRPAAHLAMMAAVQPFLCGGISKTLNLPAEATAEEIEALFVEAWRLGLKALAVYREGSKGAEPLRTHCVVDETVDGCCS